MCYDGACSYASREMRKPKKAPLTLHHTLSIVQVKPTATALAMLGILAHDTPLGAVFTPAGRLVGKSTRWTTKHAGLMSSQKST